MYQSLLSYFISNLILASSGTYLVFSFKEGGLLCLPGPSPVYQKCHSDWRKSDSYGSWLGYLKKKQTLIKVLFSKTQDFVHFINTCRWWWEWQWCFSSTGISWRVFQITGWSTKMVKLEVCKITNTKFKSYCLGQVQDELNFGRNI